MSSEVPNFSKLFEANNISIIDAGLGIYKVPAILPQNGSVWAQPVLYQCFQVLSNSHPNKFGSTEQLSRFATAAAMNLPPTQNTPAYFKLPKTYGVKKPSLDQSYTPFDYYNVWNQFRQLLDDIEPLNTSAHDRWDGQTIHKYFQYNKGAFDKFGLVSSGPTSLPRYILTETHRQKYWGVSEEKITQTEELEQWLRVDQEKKFYILNLSQSRIRLELLSG